MKTPWNQDLEKLWFSIASHIMPYLKTIQSLPAIIQLLNQIKNEIEESTSDRHQVVRLNEAMKKRTDSWLQTGGRRLGGAEGASVWKSKDV